MSLECILSGEVLKTAFKGLNVLVSEAKAHFTENGLHIRAVDPANVAMVVLEIPKDSFESYIYPEEEKVIGIDISRINEFLKKISKKSLVELKIDDSKMTIESGNIEYTIPLIDPSAIRKEPKIPELDLPVKVVLDAGDFKNYIELADKISDDVVLRSDEIAFYIEAEGDIEKLRVTLTPSELIEFNGAEAKSKFNIDYLKEFCKIAKNGDTLTILLGNDFPARLQFVICDGSAMIEYFLAPRVEVE